MTVKRVLFLTCWAVLALTVALVSGCIHADIGNMR